MQRLTLFYNNLEYVSVRTWWSGTEFTYVRLQHLIPSKCFLCAEERSLISYFPRKLGNPFTFHYVRQVTLYSQKFASWFYLPCTLFHFKFLSLHSRVAPCESVGFLFGHIIVIYTFCWIVAFLFGWIIGCIIGSCFVIVGFRHQFIVEFVSLLVGWSLC